MTFALKMYGKQYKTFRAFGIIGMLMLFLAAALLCCSIAIVEAQDACNQRAETGICRASIQRYYYNFRSGQCDTFIYGGCGGNKNNFRSIGQCFSFRSYCLRRRAGK